MVLWVMVFVVVAALSVDVVALSVDVDSFEFKQTTQVNFFYVCVFVGSMDSRQIESG